MSIATAHSGGKLQFNSGTIQISAEFPFLNHLKGGQNWSRYGSVGGPPAPDTLDENGYPHTLPVVGDAAGVSTVFYVPHHSLRPGNYVLKWDGNGTVTCTGSVVSGEATSTTGSGRLIMDLSGQPADTDENFPHFTRISFGITATEFGSNVRNVVFVHVDDEALYDAGEVFGTLFKQRLVEGGAGVWRDLGWGDKNGNMMTDWASRKPVGHWSYQAEELRSEWYAGVATGSAGAYSLTVPGFVLADKAILQWFPNHTTPTEAVTLTVNGVSKPLYHPTGSAFDPSEVGVVGGPLPTQDRLRTVIYDQALDCWLLHGTMFGNGLQNGIPPEVFLQLCAEMGMHPWYVQPHLSADPGTDFMSSLAQMVKDYCTTNGITWMIPRFEGPNELWNYGPAFPQTGYALAKSKARWGDANGSHHEWYGRTMSVVGQEISAVYGGDRSKYWVIAGVHTAGEAPDAQTARFESPLHVADTSAAQAAKNWVTHLCAANYWNVSPEEEAVEADVAAAWDAAATQDEKDAIIADYIATAITELNVSFKTIHEAWGAYAGSLGIGFTFYEGNYSPDTNKGEPRNSLRMASKRDPQLFYGYHLSYAICEGAGGQFPAVLNFSGGGPFSAQEPSIYADTLPAWQAIKAYAQGKRRFKTTG